MDEMEKKLENYKKSRAFESDCLSMKSEFIIKENYLPDDLEIEEKVLAKKRKDLEGKGDLK